MPTKELEIIVYGLSENACPYCTMAKNLLASKNLSYTYIDVTDNEKEKEKMRAIWLDQLNNPRPTAPLIIINGNPIGGAAELQNFIRDFNKTKLTNS